MLAATIHLLTVYATFVVGTYFLNNLLSKAYGVAPMGFAAIAFMVTYLFVGVTSFAGFILTAQALLAL